MAPASVSDQQGVTQLAAREIPLPVALSAEAQAIMAASKPASAPRPALDDRDGWRDYIAARNAELAPIAASRLANVDADVIVRDMGGVAVYVGAPRSVASSPGQALVHLRGGGLLLGGGEQNMRLEAATVAQRTGRKVFAIDYAVPPDCPFPSALDQCEKVYREILNEGSPKSLVISGTSAGGNLACGLVMRSLDRNLRPADGLVLMSPEVDLTESGDSFHTLMGLDTRLTFRLTEFNRLYAGGADLSDPYLSPLFAEVSHFPATFLQSGTRDLFLSNTVRMHRRLRKAGVRAELHVWDGMPHLGFGGAAPEDSEIDTELRLFLGGLIEALKNLTQG